MIYGIFMNKASVTLSSIGKYIIAYCDPCMFLTIRVVSVVEVTSTKAIKSFRTIL